MKKIFVHIGLPKTGTTTLQKNFFPNIDTFDYCGVHQPRVQQKKNNNPVYNNIMQYVNSGAGSLKRILNVINNNANEQILISEEMLTVSENWLQKLKRLFEVVSHYDYSIIVTVRDPLKATFSYYIETYERFF
ncbi:sulfotransferase domain-containing protein [Vreelandella aquamarina]|jgi:hypothetical protein|uniref:sulfotransferase domain-containing protein n=1 Tax=Vreelandella aquamarina TaxID=77097 RepID=UPI001D195D51|nr:sulfotransferase domain-containing protein [Halomonas meridiana]MCC4288870.1 sulfotransferase domain-containing protein [Halomonas meridiana]